jgi:hypothetical protein
LTPRCWADVEGDIPVDSKSILCKTAESEMWTLVPKKSTTPPANTSTVPWIDNHKVTYVPTDDRGEVFPAGPAAAVKLQAAVRGKLVRLARRPIQVKYACANARFVTKACVCPESANKGAKKTIKRRKRITKRLRFTSSKYGEPGPVKAANLVVQISSRSAEVEEAY